MFSSELLFIVATEDLSAGDAFTSLCLRQRMDVECNENAFGTTIWPCRVQRSFLLKRQKFARFNFAGECANVRTTRQCISHRRHNFQFCQRIFCVFLYFIISFNVQLHNNLSFCCRCRLFSMQFDAIDRINSKAQRVLDNRRSAQAEPKIEGLLPILDFCAVFFFRFFSVGRAAVVTATVHDTRITCQIGQMIHFFL